MGDGQGHFSEIFADLTQCNGHFQIVLQISLNAMCVATSNLQISLNAMCVATSNSELLYDVSPHSAFSFLCGHLCP